MEHIAHSREKDDPRPWQLLSGHLEEVAALAKEFAPEGFASLAETAARWHDAGKYQLAFQRYIKADPESSNEDNPAVRSVPHSAAGAALAFDIFGPNDPRSHVLALVVEAHHGALKSSRAIADVVQQRGAPLLKAARESGMPQELESQQPICPANISALGVRMLFSALVDADLLNTEAWANGKGRETQEENIHVLRDRLALACEKKIEGSRETTKTDAEASLSAMRERVYMSCVAKATDAPGSFTLTVPTGGGKTLSGMAFALHHAVKHGMRRVIVVAPYTSILEQTADVYRKVLGHDNVVEHHSNLDPLQDTDRNRQACENWDAPVIVTTSVQFFESLYAAHKAPCRKLHRIANSVILLDEVQTFPEGMLEPIHFALKQLAERFNVTIVHGTATQPLLVGTKNELSKAVQMEHREIIDTPAMNFEVVRSRFELRRLGDLSQPISPEELAQRVMQYPSVLAIVHSRVEAQQTAEHLGDDCFHLSAAMCAEHRGAVLAEVRRRLRAGESCRLVATQLVEAGVDIDFPVVFRALAGLSTLAQAAGRCNREMKLPGPGQFFVFRPGLPKDGNVVPSQPPLGSPRLAAELALSRYFSEGDPDLNNPNLFPKFTRSVLQLLGKDIQRVMEAEKDWDFPSVADRFKMIDDSGIPVVAPYGDAMTHVVRLRGNGPDAGATRQNFRRLQRYTVSLPAWRVERMLSKGFLEPVLRSKDDSTPGSLHEVLWMVRNGIPDVYHPRFGFTPEAGERIDPGHLIV